MARPLGGASYANQVELQTDSDSANITSLLKMYSFVSPSFLFVADITRSHRAH